MDYLIFIIVILLNLFLVMKKPKKSLGKIIGLFGLIGMIIYSGIGILLFNLELIDLLKFCFYITIYTFIYIIIVNFNTGKKGNKEISTKNTLTLKLAKTLAIVYILLYLFYLVYPANRLLIIFNPPKLDIANILERTEEINSGLNRYVYTLQVLLIPFFYIYIYKLWINKQRFKTIIYLLLNFYLNMLKYEYFGRTDVVTFALILMFIIVYKNGYEGRLRQIVFSMSFLAILLTPFLFTYVYIRSGNKTNVTDIFEMFTNLINNECYYPIYYNSIISMNVRVSIIEYLKWLLTLPIPKSIFPVDTIAINNYFSIAITGNTNITAITLPSILGEGLIIFGERFYFLHSILLAFLTGIATNLYEKRNYLVFYGIYIAIRNMAMGRGGSQGFLSTIINTSILLIIIEIINYLYNKKNEKGNVNKWKAVKKIYSPHFYHFLMDQ